jgi:hypothetical protein
MIDTISIEIEGRLYEWTYDPQIASADDCWVWGDARTCITPPGTVVVLLNRRFIDEHAASIAGGLDPDDVPRFEAILRSMGATDADFEKPGMEHILAVSNPERFEQRRFDILPASAHSPLSCPELRDWIFNENAQRAQLFPYVNCVGEGPFQREDFIDFLNRRNLNHHEAPLGHLVIGRKGWTENQVDGFIDQHRGRNLRIYSQEMFVLMLYTGLDPFYAGPDVLRAFRAGHPGLEFVSEGWVGWVSTFVPLDDRGSKSSRRSGGASGWQAESPLHAMGYKVGKQGLNSVQRSELLRRAFMEGIPRVGTADYMAEWGEPGTPERLKKLANYIASNCRNMKKRQSPSEEAIHDWEVDLAWLKRSFYRGHFAFQWPDTST